MTVRVVCQSSDSLHYYCIYKDKTCDFKAQAYIIFKSSPVSVFRFSVMTGGAQSFSCFIREVSLVIIQLWDDI